MAIIYIMETADTADECIEIIFIMIISGSGSDKWGESSGPRRGQMFIDIEIKYTVQPHQGLHKKWNPYGVWWRA